MTYYYKKLSPNLESRLNQFNTELATFDENIKGVIERIDGWLIRYQLDGEITHELLKLKNCMVTLHQTQNSFNKQLEDFLRTVTKFMQDVEQTKLLDNAPRIMEVLKLE